MAAPSLRHLAVLPRASEGIELHPGVKLLPLDAEEVQRLARHVDPQADGGISVADLAGALVNIAEEAERRLRHMQAQCRAVLALLPGDERDPSALSRHPAFKDRLADTPEGEALSDLMHAIGAARELVSNGIAGFCDELGDQIAVELEEAGVLSERLAQIRKRGEAEQQAGKAASR